MAERVFIVDDRPDILELNRILLEAEGYETEGHAYADVTPETLYAAAPRVVLLDLPRDDETPWTFLKRLRADARTAAISVVVTSGAPALIDRALGDVDLRVSAGVMMPFEIDALYSAVAAAAGRSVATVLATESNPTAHAAAVALRDGRTRVLFAWGQRLSALDAFRMHPDLTLAELQGHGGEVLDFIADTLDRGEVIHAATAAAMGVYTSEAARNHGCTRRDQGIPMPYLAREIAALRHETWRAVYSVIVPLSPPLVEVWETLRCLDMALDEALQAMLEAWSEQESGDREDTPPWFPPVDEGGV